MRHQQENVRAIFADSIQARSLAAAARIVAAMIALTMLITLPAERAHSFSLHLRAPVVRRSAQAHLSVAQPEASAAQQLRLRSLLPTPFVALEDASPSRPLLCSGEQTEIPLSRLLRHLKLGIARTSSPDPLV
jgi:hypothetical protein